ncbi:Glutamate [NMDA] receptor subunit 1 [Tetrabaena socialis]|uniref:Glutamate [NMDA] receptor subunit 1 n=1 Tax=Tetrabaena socialis TaxID=47790 RepID=A0A2J8A6H2_9CHLO|nr:Glutamate [NMDA] receptor subunit 1 [Tetrabaena socialis]|eukprot:PNH08131.1 Glutamate [NMDA] receptor subunit 1 [Tetrabaena socialis]
MAVAAAVAQQGVPLRVCTSAWAPFVLFNVTTGVLSGYEIDLFEAVASQLKLSWNYSVMEWDDMMNALLLPRSDPSHCDIAPASIPVTTADMGASIKFSYPTFRSGYAVAVGVSGKSTDYWGFTKVFSWELWVAMLVSGLGMSILVWLAERDFSTRGMGKIKYPLQFRPGMYEATYRMYGKLLNTVDEPRVTSLPAKIMVLGWGLMVLVTIATYTAGLTARLTAVSIKTKITSVADLPRYKVGTWDVIAKNFMKYGVRPEPLPWNTEEDGLKMLEMVATGELDALILDNPWLRYQLANRCDITIVGRLFQYVNNAVGFNANTSQGFIDQYNSALAQLIEDGMYETLELAYIRESSCGKVDPTTTIGFYNLLGVYVIMAACCVLGLLLMVLPRLSSRFDVDIKGGTSMDVDREQSFVGRTVSRIGRALSTTGSKPSMTSPAAGVVKVAPGPSVTFKENRSMRLFSEDSSNLQAVTEVLVHPPSSDPPTGADRPFSPASNQQGQPVNDEALQGVPLRVCTSAWAPFVFYNDTTEVLSGYEIDLFEAVASQLKLSFEYSVMDWGDMMNALLLPLNDSAHCDIAPASIPVTTTDLNSLIQFSTPTFRSGYAVAVGVSGKSTDYWGFAKVFSWELWVAMLISGLGISILVWLAERDFSTRGMGKIKYPLQFRPGMYEATYRMYGKLLNTVDEPRVTSLPAKIMVLGWGLTVLVTIATYTAGLTARLTAVTIKTKISGVADLPGYKVGTWDAIAKNFIKYGVRPEPLPWNTEEDGLKMLEMVATGELDALILDNPWLRYQLAGRCDITIVGRMFQYVNNAVGFNAGTPTAFIDQYNSALAQLIEDGMYETLELAYIRESSCGKVDPTTTIGFYNLLGVYVIMAACTVLGLLLMVLPRLSSRFDVDIKGGTSVEIDRERSFVGRTASRIGRAFSTTGSRFSVTGGGGAKVVPDVSIQQPARMFYDDSSNLRTSVVSATAVIVHPNRRNSTGTLSSAENMPTDLSPGLLKVVVEPYSPADLEVQGKPDNDKKLVKQWSSEV